jgi:hypothetical protein
MKARRLAALLAVATAAGAASACEIRVSRQRSDNVLQVVPLGSAREVTLTYLHSVTHTPVRETLALGRDGFVQQRIEFTEHGPGMPTEALPGERFLRTSHGFVIENMQRPVGILNMRVDPAQQQVLEAGGGAISLTRWGRQALRLQPHDCD